MVLHRSGSWGVEFNLFDTQGTESNDGLYAHLITEVLKVAEGEDYLLDMPDPFDKSPHHFEETPLIDRMEALAEERRFVAMVYDHEVPAVLGMLRTVLSNVLDPNRDRAPEDGYSSLPTGALRVLIGSLEEYESLREDV